MNETRLQEEVYDLLYAKNKPECAVLRLNGILEEEPENVEALSLKAYALNKLANTTKDWKYSKSAVTSADKALALNPLNDIALTSKGWALIDLGRARESVTYLVRATHANPKNEYAWYNLAWAQYLTGNFAESSASINKAVELDPNNSIIRKGKLMMQSGNLPNHLKIEAASQ
jgi:tetratricopeptide (TPR) repeat protein